MAKAVAITEQCPMEIGLNILGGKWQVEIENPMANFQRSRALQ